MTRLVDLFYSFRKGSNMQLICITSNGILARFETGLDTLALHERVIPFQFVTFLKSLKGENVSLRLGQEKVDLPSHKHENVLAYLPTNNKSPVMLHKIFSLLTTKPIEEFIL